MIDTVVSVKPRRDRVPGFIKFSSAGEKSTFSDDVLRDAEALIGQRAEYTLEEREGKGGKVYQNVGSIVPAAQPASRADAGRSSAAQEDVELLSIATALNRIASALERMTTVIPFGPPPPRLPMQEKPQERALPEQQAQAEPTAQDRLAKKVGVDAARAMIAALQAKHKDPAAFSAAVEALLLAHGA